jgi:acyl transferase domain-containing protein/thioesterase domain-containing protein/acyl carrier protein
MSDLLLSTIRETDIAVIGMSSRFPGAENVDAFWKNLQDGVESISFFSDDELEVNDPALLNRPEYVKAGAVVPGIDLFDASFFGYGPKEAGLMDPQHRIFLECAWEALENAGYDPEMFGGLIGVYAGTAMNTYLINNVHPACGYSPQRTFLESTSDLQVLLGNGVGFMPTRVSYKLNLKGPSVNVQTACSTGLVAVHMACQSLLAGECDMALAGAVTIRVPSKKGYLYQEGMIFSPDGHCRAFDAQARGTVFGDGIGIVVLKLLSSAIADGDGIHAVIRGSAINNDGSMKVGYSAPSVDGQTDVITQAIEVADIDPATITYVETHGTGTPLGDPVEIAALTRAFRERTRSALKGKTGYCAIGSVKTNIGHLAEAAGLAGLIKTILALKHKVLPATLHFSDPNPNIDFASSPFYVNKQSSEWKVTDAPRRAGVSAFGMGGTNAHVILEEAPVAAPEGNSIDRGRHIFTISTRSVNGLQELTRRYETFLSRQPDVSLADVCFTANTGRRHFSHRLAIVAKSTTQLRSRLAALGAGSKQDVISVTKGPIGAEQNASVNVAPSLKRIAFLFPGQGSQYFRMGQQLYNTQPVFRQTLDCCDSILRDGGYLRQPLLDLLYRLDGKPLRLDRTAYAQPAIFAVEYALAKMWNSWGIRPDVVMGHSLGEYAAACLAAVFSLEDGLRLVAERGRLMQSTKPGEMAAVWASEAQVIAAISNVLKEQPGAGVISIAAINGPSSVVISGTRHAVRAACAFFAAQGIMTKKLRVSHAFHSPLMEPILTDFEQVARSITWSRPKLKLISNVTGMVADEESAEPAYWVRHAQQPVRFAAGMETLDRLAVDVLLEIGPDTVLLGLGRNCLPDHQGLWLSTLRQSLGNASDSEHDDWEQLLTSLGTLHVHGVPVNWFGFDRDYERRRVHLPTYPFQQKRYWIEAPKVWAQSSSRGKHPLLGSRLTLADTREIRFQSRISVNSPAWLKNHHGFQSTTLSETYYLEMALAAGAATLNSDTLSLSDVRFLEPLRLTHVPDGGTTVQVILSPEGSHLYCFRIYGLTPGRCQASDETWTLHASGKLLKAGEAAVASLPQLYAQRGEEVPVDACYQYSYQRELYSGSAFKLVQKLWRNGNSVLGQINYPEELLLEAEEYQLHPALSDFSIIRAVLPDRHKDTSYVITGLESLRVFPRRITDVWSYAKVQKDNGTSSSAITEFETFVVDLRVFAPDGQLVADIEGLQLNEVRREAHSGIRILLEQEEPDRIEWQPQARYRLLLDEIPKPSEISSYLHARFHQLMSQPSMDAYKKALTRLEDISITYVLNAFIAMGWEFQLNQRFSTASMGAELGVSNERWLDRLLTMLEQVGILRSEQEGGRLTQGRSWKVISLPVITGAHAALDALSCAEASPEVTLLKRCGTNLAHALQATCNPIEVLFPEGDTSDVARFYQESPILRAMNALMQEAISYILSRLPPKRRIRILEIGAGAGATTSHIVPHLPEHQTEYVFTDVGASFLTKARARFEAYPFVSYRILDIEKPADSQGVECQRYDLVVAANVVHATRDLGQTMRHVRQLLAPKGILLMMEGTAPARWIDVTFGFAEQWWRFADDYLRPSHPLLGVKLWQKLLAESGFSEVAAISTEDYLGKEAGLSQAVFIAQAATLAERQTPLAEHDVEDQAAFRTKDRSVVRPIRRPRLLSAQSKLIQSLEQAVVPHAELVRQLEQVRADKRRDLLAAYIRKQVGQVLGMDMTDNADEQIAHDQAFFDMGMDSLTAIELRVGFQRDLGRSLPSTLIYDCPTVEALVDYLGHEIRSGFDPRGDGQAPYNESLAQTRLRKEIARNDSSCSTLVPIQPHGFKRPFFCVPGILGDVSQFQRLARCLGKDQPFYGLRPLGLDEERSPYEDMADIANHHIQGVRAVQPTGPYLLGGHSFGGLVAFEMAQQMLHRGYGISVLVIMDVQAAVGENYRHVLDGGAGEEIIRLARVFERTADKNIAVSPKDIEALDASAQLKYLAQRLRLAGLRYTETEVRRLHNVVRANVRAMARYRPGSSYQTPITFFRANEIHPQDRFLPDEAATLKDPTWGWNQLSSAPVEPYIVPGNHFTMMTEPHVQMLGQQIIACLASTVVAASPTIGMTFAE